MGKWDTESVQMATERNKSTKQKPYEHERTELVEMSKNIIYCFLFRVHILHPLSVCVSPILLGPFTAHCCYCCDCYMSISTVFFFLAREKSVFRRLTKKIILEKWNVRLFTVVRWQKIQAYLKCIRKIKLWFLTNQREEENFHCRSC